MKILHMFNANSYISLSYFENFSTGHKDILKGKGKVYSLVLGIPIHTTLHDLPSIAIWTFSLPEHTFTSWRVFTASNEPLCHSDNTLSN